MINRNFVYWRILLYPVTVLMKLFFVLHQRRQIRKCDLLIFPGFEKDIAYDKIAIPLVKPIPSKVFLQFSDLKPKYFFDNDPLIKVLIGCRLDDGKSSITQRYSETNDKNPLAILSFLKYFQSNFKIQFTYVRKGPLFPDFDDLTRIYNNANISLIGIEPLPYADFVDVMQKHDIVIDSLGPAIPGRISIDALALGKFLITNTTKFPFTSQFSQHLKSASDERSLRQIFQNLEPLNVISHRSKCEHSVDNDFLSLKIQGNTVLSTIRKLS